MADWALDPSTGDLALTGGKATVIRGPDAAGQRLRCRMRLFEGDWFLDQRQGIPYHRYIFPKESNQAVRRSIFRSVIASMPEVKEVLSLDVDLNPRSRTLNVSGEAQLLDGTILPLGINGPLFEFAIAPTTPTPPVTPPDDDNSFEDSLYEFPVLF